MPDPHQDRKRLTFEQAEGAEPMPTQLRPKEVSRELRAKLWAVIHESLMAGSTYSDMGGPRYFTDPWKSILIDKHVMRDHRMADEFVNSYKGIVPGLKRVFEEGDYVAIFGLTEWLLRHPKRPYSLDKAVIWALAQSRAAYRVVDGNTIAPVASEQEGRALAMAFADVAGTEFNGARAHLRRAAEELTAGNYAPSIRESITAVEAVARVLEPTARTLDPALARLEKVIGIHPALRGGFGKLYGFTSAEQGIRHALIDEGKAPVDEADALYMLGSCAAFVSYLIHKARVAGL